MDLAFEAGSWWAYVVVFLAAAIPILEILVVIPAGILAGMPVVPTAGVAVAGNLSTVVLVAVAGDRILGWWRRRRPDERGGPNPRSQRARVLVQRWGVPGLALLAPITTGTHVAVIAALATGSDGRRVLRWMTIGLIVWAVAAAATAAAGLDLLG